MTPWTWLALLAALAGTGAIVTWVRRRTAGRIGARVFFTHPSAALGLAILVFFAVAALAAPLLAPFPYWQQLDIVHLQNRPPSWTYLLGTDLFSRDSWSRLLFGARVSLGVGALATLVAVTIGGLVGALAGYFRGGVDALLMRTVDVGLAVPRVFFLLMIAALWEGISLPALVLLLGLTGWFATSRLVRAEVLSLRERDFVAAARAQGAGSTRVIVRHVLPNAAAPLIVSAALGVGNVLLLEAGLSFLGIGVRPPLPSWGNMIGDGARHFFVAPWATLFPGLAIALVVMACNAVGDALRDALDPRQELR